MKKKLFSGIKKARNVIFPERGDAKAVVTVLFFLLAAALTGKFIMDESQKTTESWYEKGTQQVEDNLGW